MVLDRGFQDRLRCSVFPERLVECPRDSRGVLPCGPALRRPVPSPSSLTHATERGDRLGSGSNRMVFFLVVEACITGVVI